MSQELIVKDNGLQIRAELDTQITTAKAYPRDEDRAISKVEKLALISEETAQSCFYVLARKDKDGNRKEIRGASIRFAEIVASAWGNIHIATRLIDNDGKNITAEGVAWDLETNVRQSAQVKVSIRFGKGKNEFTANSDMQTVLAGAASSKARRNAIFMVVPMALFNGVLQKAMNYSVGDQKTVNAKVIEIFDKLTKMGIDRQKILDFYDHKTLSEFTGEEFRSLIGVGTAIKEGWLSIDKAFSSDEDEEGGEETSALDKINKMLADKKKPDIQATAPAEEVNEDTGEIK